MALRTDKQRKARALKMLESKILEGKTNKQIAKDFGVTPDTVSKALSLAQKADIVVRFEDRLYSELLPLAHDAVAGALSEGNAKIGLAVLQGTQILRPQGTRSKRQEAEDDELARYVAQKRLSAQIAADTADGEIVAPGAPLALTAPSEAHSPADPAGSPKSLPAGPGSPETDPS